MLDNLFINLRVMWHLLPVFLKTFHQKKFPSIYEKIDPIIFAVLFEKFYQFRDSLLRVDVFPKIYLQAFRDQDAHFVELILRAIVIRNMHQHETNFIVLTLRLLLGWSLIIEFRIMINKFNQIVDFIIDTLHIIVPSLIRERNFFLQEFHFLLKCLLLRLVAPIVVI